jgi:hypothetical protein
MQNYSGTNSSKRLVGVLCFVLFGGLYLPIPATDLLAIALLPRFDLFQKPIP